MDIHNATMTSKITAVNVTFPVHNMHQVDLNSDNSTTNATNVMDNYSEEMDLLLHMGVRYRDLISVTILLIVYSLIFVSGTVGNVCTCIVIVKNQYMHTSTNFYLFSLAISDVLILLFGKYASYLNNFLCGMMGPCRPVDLCHCI